MIEGSQLLNMATKLRWLTFYTFTNYSSISMASNNVPLPTLTFSYEAISDTYGRITSINTVNINSIA